MHRPNPINTATLPTPNLISRSPLRRSFPVVLLAVGLGFFALSTAARAVDPPHNTAIGFDTLYHAYGSFNTAIGCFALFSNTIGENNVATGDRAL